MFKKTKQAKFHILRIMTAVHMLRLTLDSITMKTITVIEILICI